MTAIQRYIDITDKSEIDVDCYFALVTATAAKAGSDVSVLDKIDMSCLSDPDLVDIYLLRALLFLKCNEVEKALEEGKIASEKAFTLGQDGDCHFVMGLIACYTADYIEAAFRRSLLPADFQLKPRFVNLIKRLTFKEAKWQLRTVDTYNGKPRYTPLVDITKEMPIPPNFMV
ncbi:hypothetical protein ABW19_dt0201633 [Dactylella cylindrospora]|nr:hypothetical protein ABW19_dt0201633 [Dactylella cylindrospora]